MADEENKNLEETADEAVENAAEESSSSAETPAGEDSSAPNDDAVEASSDGDAEAGEDSSAPNDDAVEASSDGDAEEPSAEAEAEVETEPEEQLSPTERRKRNKSRLNRKPKFTGSHEERREQRLALRGKKAARRRAQRAKQREAHKAAGPREGTPATVKEPGRKKVQQGIVVSSKNEKTIIVEIEMQESHRIYKKVVRHTKKLSAHDERNDANEGDTVRVVESRPLSRTKRWRLVEILERAK